MALTYHSATRNLPFGYSFRGATFHDMPVVAYLLNLRQISSSTSLLAEEIHQEWQTPKFNPAMDVRLIFDPREHLIGYIEVLTAPDMPTQPWLWGCVHPDYEGRGIGTTLLRWAEARVCLFMDMLPAPQRISPHFGAAHDLVTAPALCTALGWQRTGTANKTVRQPKAMCLIQGVGNPAYDIYEKEICS